MTPNQRIKTKMLIWTELKWLGKQVNMKHINCLEMTHMAINNTVLQEQFLAHIALLIPDASMEILPAYVNVS